MTERWGRDGGHAVIITYRIIALTLSVLLTACTSNLVLVNEGAERKKFYVCSTPVGNCIILESTVGANCRCDSVTDGESPGFDIFDGYTTHDPCPMCESGLDYGNYDVVEVFFGTDRSYVRSAPSNKRYGSERGEFRYGVSYLSIPKIHTEGEVERPTNYVVLMRDEDPEKDISILNMRMLSRDTFFEMLTKNNNHEAIIFIHGFNVSHSEALWRAAQLKHDLEFFGSMIAYSWPSNGVIEKYTVDESNVQRTEFYLKSFILDVKAKLNPDKVHIIAHSMGNRALMRVLYELNNEFGTKLLNQVILAAPDVDSEVFEQKIKPSVSIAQNITLYSSSDDVPLKASKLLHDYARAGQGGEDVLLIEGVDTIDASAINGGLLEHSYFAKEMLLDIDVLIDGYKEPEVRGMAPKTIDTGKYWLMPGFSRAVE